MMPVHLCNGGEADDSGLVLVRIACDRSWVAPNLSIDSEDDGREVFVTTDGRLYTYDDELVTCEGCKP